jgi:hypothetical protein
MCVRVGIHVCSLGMAFMYVFFRVGIHVCIRVGVHVYTYMNAHPNTHT